MWQEVIYPVAFVLLVLLPAPLLGSYMYRVFEGKSRWLSPIERATLACCGTDGREQDWKSYALSLLAFNGAGFGLLFLILMAQGLLCLVSDGRVMDNALDAVAQTALENDLSQSHRPISE